MIRDVGGSKGALDVADSSCNITAGSCQVSGWQRVGFLKLWDAVKMGRKSTFFLPAPANNS